MTSSPSTSRIRFVATIFAGSFLLFLVQPMVARMALPRLGGAPNVWNSAMLVYQALLLAGYGYAHRLGRMPLQRQAKIHLALLIVAALTLPIGLVDLPQPQSGWEVLWVPALLAASIGPVFLLVSAQAPLMQRWYAADASAGEPWALYAASNLGSFSGLIAYPLLVEPLLPLSAQGWVWSAGYVLLIALVALAAAARWRMRDAVAETQAAAPAAPVPLRRILLWLALSAVPSGLMLSTTTHLTTDIFAMPLLWVIPLGLYLLSFVFAFADSRRVAGWMVMFAPTVLLLIGSMAMVSRNSSSLTLVILTVAMLFVLCVALHARLYDLRPEPGQLTLFYFVMSAGGVLGGVFTALIAPLVFDWVWEHPLLVLAAAALLPRVPLLDWTRLPGLEPGMRRIGLVALIVTVLTICWLLRAQTVLPESTPERAVLAIAAAMVGLALVPWRWAFVAALLAIMLAQGGLETAQATRDGLRTRSYFGIYTVRDYPDAQIRTLAHGTTLHGQQSFDPKFRDLPNSYYSPGSGAGIVFANAQRVYGQGARIGVVGLGAGTLACYRKPGEQWRFFEIDPAVLNFSRNGTFTYVSDCAPDARVVLGDARLSLASAAPASFDVLAIDAFSSDAIPLHLLTDEAIGVYLKALSAGGVLLVHISNRYIDLEPVLAAAAKERGLAVKMRDDVPPANNLFTPSSWVLIARDPATLDRFGKLAPALPLTPIAPPAPRVWTDDRASILPYVRWGHLIGKK